MDETLDSDPVQAAPARGLSAKGRMQGYQTKLLWTAGFILVFLVVCDVHTTGFDRTADPVAPL